MKDSVILINHEMVTCMGTENIIEKLATKLKGGLLSDWDEKAVDEFSAEVANNNSVKVQKALDEGMSDDDVVENVLFSKARSALRGVTMEKYGNIIRDTHDDDYMSWKAPKKE